MTLSTPQLSDYYFADDDGDEAESYSGLNGGTGIIPHVLTLPFTFPLTEKNKNEIEEQVVGRGVIVPQLANLRVLEYVLRLSYSNSQEILIGPVEKYYIRVFKNPLATLSDFGLQIIDLSDMIKFASHRVPHYPTRHTQLFDKRLVKNNNIADFTTQLNNEVGAASLASAAVFSENFSPYLFAAVHPVLFFAGKELKII